MKNNFKPKPFLKWAGGKTQLLSQFDSILPKKFNNYIEPMVGGGAVYFHLYKKQLINNAVLIDLNAELINVYQVLKENVDSLLEKLVEMKDIYQANPKTYFYKIRNIDRDNNFHKKDNLEKAARTIFLNKTCFNGLFRVNKKGLFNTPIGRYSNPTIVDKDNLLEVSKALQNVQIVNADFEDSINYVNENDFIYIDPPYYPISKTAYFTSYTKDNFLEDEQIRLRDFAIKLAKKKALVMLSNSDTDFIKEIYNEPNMFNIHKVNAKRFINSKSSGRGLICELVITNY